MKMVVQTLLDNLSQAFLNHSYELISSKNTKGCGSIANAMAALDRCKLIQHSRELYLLLTTLVSYSTV